MRRRPRSTRRQPGQFRTADTASVTGQQSEQDRLHPPPLPQLPLAIAAMGPAAGRFPELQGQQCAVVGFIVAAATLLAGLRHGSQAGDQPCAAMIPQHVEAPLPVEARRQGDSGVEAGQLLQRAHGHLPGQLAPATLALVVHQHRPRQAMSRTALSSGGSRSRGNRTSASSCWRSNHRPLHGSGRGANLSTDPPTGCGGSPSARASRPGW